MKPENLQRIAQASDLLGGVLRKLLTTDRGLHAETAVASAARMTGTMLLRSFESGLAGLPRGSVLVSEAADAHGRALLETLFATLQQLGHPALDAASLRGRRESTAQSRLTLAETRRRLEPWYAKTAAVSGLAPREAAAAAAIATAALIHDCRSVLDVHAGCSIAVHGLIESMRTVPGQVAPDG